MNDTIDDSILGFSSFGSRIARIIIAGGGTGGHIFPAIAIANAIVKLQPKAQILFVGASGKMEMEKVPLAGFRIEGLTIAGFNRSSLIKNIGLPFKLLKSFFQVSNIFKSFKPTAVIGVGGYSSFPVLRYAQAKGIDTFIHESNSYAGKSNKMLAKKATKIFVAIDGMDKFFPSNKIIQTGNPVRENIVSSKLSREEAILFFGLDPNKKTVLAIGGSLGAKNINEALAAGINEFNKNDLQLIWQTGKPNAAAYVTAANDYANVYVSSFIDDMSAAYTAADIVVSRSGAMAVAEISITGKAAIFVPYPHAAEDHQTYNALALVENGAAKMVKDNDVDQKLIPLLQSLMQDDQSRHLMEEKIKAYAFTNADEVIAAQILQHI